VRTNHARAMPVSAGRNPGTKIAGFVYVTPRPLSLPKHNAPLSAALSSAARHRGHLPLNAGMTSSPAQGPVRSTMVSPSSVAVSSPDWSASAIAAMISSDWEGVRNRCLTAAGRGTASRAAE
jgi:hypothetical protein